ncbi:MAG: pro-sigmaK processing inhibitor BofA family protein [Oscillospiraceae bacterium]
MELLKENGYWLLWSFIALWVVFFYIRHKKRIRSFLLGSATGLTSLVLLHIFGGAIGYAPTLSLTNILFCGLLGIPATVLLVLGELFL